ncbi:MAG: hypothetical protein AAB946_02230 [Patescibacteria group bacterium]
MRFFSFLEGSGEKQEKGKSAGRENLGGKFMAVPEAPGNFEEGEMPTKEQLEAGIAAEEARGDNADLERIDFLKRRLENLD